jgi:hypothetical protein
MARKYRKREKVKFEAINLVLLRLLMCEPFLLEGSSVKELAEDLMSLGITIG